MRPHHSHTRDSSLRRLALANRWLIAGSVALTGVLTEVAAQAFPGKAKASSTTSSTQKAKTTTHHSSGSHTSTAKALTAPSKAPEATSEPSSSATESSSG